jgi:hypothetical protein
MGWTLSPPLGGLMYNAGGFTLPFAVFGPLPTLVLILILLLMPPDEDRTLQPAQSTGEAQGPVHRVLEPKLPPAWVRVGRLMTPGLAITAVLAMSPSHPSPLRALDPFSGPGNTFTVGHPHARYFWISH